jgi:hypothetical protein
VGTFTGIRNTRPSPEAAPVDADPKPARYVLPNMLLKDVRSPEMGDFHKGAAFGEPRIRGNAADRWLERFDVPPGELLDIMAKLLKEPKLGKETTLPGRL